MWIPQYPNCNAPPPVPQTISGRPALGRRDIGFRQQLSRVSVGTNLTIGYAGLEEDPAMPLRDHFRPPLSDRRSWEGFHAQWPAMIVIGLNRNLPERYVAEPQVHLGSSVEIDVAAYDERDADPPPAVAGGDG